MSILPISSWKITSPIESPTDSSVAPQTQDKKKLDQAVISDVSFYRYQNANVNAMRSLDPITESNQANTALSSILQVLQKDLKSTLYVHTILSHTSVMNLITPPAPVATSHHIQLDHFTQEAR